EAAVGKGSAEHAAELGDAAHRNGDVERPAARAADEGGGGLGIDPDGLVQRCDFADGDAPLYRIRQTVVSVRMPAGLYPQHGARARNPSRSASPRPARNRATP